MANELRESLSDWWKDTNNQNKSNMATTNLTSIFGLAIIGLTLLFQGFYTSWTNNFALSFLDGPWGLALVHSLFLGYKFSVVWPLLTLANGLFAYTLAGFDLGWGLGVVRSLFPFIAHRFHPFTIFLNIVLVVLRWTPWLGTLVDFNFVVDLFCDVAFWFAWGLSLVAVSVFLCTPFVVSLFILAPGKFSLLLFLWLCALLTLTALSTGLASCGVLCIFYRLSSGMEVNAMRRRVYRKVTPALSVSFLSVLSFWWRALSLRVFFGGLIRVVHPCVAIIASFHAWFLSLLPNRLQLEQLAVDKTAAISDRWISVWKVFRAYAAVYRGQGWIGLSESLPTPIGIPMQVATTALFHFSFYPWSPEMAAMATMERNTLFARFALFLVLFLTPLVVPVLVMSFWFGVTLLGFVFLGSGSLALTQEWLFTLFFCKIRLPREKIFRSFSETVRLLSFVRLCCPSHKAS